MVTSFPLTSTLISKYILGHECTDKSRVINILIYCNLACVTGPTHIFDNGHFLDLPLCGQSLNENGFST